MDDDFPDDPEAGHGGYDWASVAGRGWRPKDKEIEMSDAVSQAAKDAREAQEAQGGRASRERKSAPGVAGKATFGVTFVKPRVEAEEELVLRSAIGSEYGGPIMSVEALISAASVKLQEGDEIEVSVRVISRIFTERRQL